MSVRLRIPGPMTGRRPRTLDTSTLLGAAILRGETVPPDFCIQSPSVHPEHFRGGAPVPAASGKLFPQDCLFREVQTLPERPGTAEPSPHSPLVNGCMCRKNRQHGQSLSSGRITRHSSHDFPQDFAPDDYPLEKPGHSADALPVCTEIADPPARFAGQTEKICHTEFSPLSGGRN